MHKNGALQINIAGNKEVSCNTEDIILNTASMSWRIIASTARAAVINVRVKTRKEQRTAPKIWHTLDFNIILSVISIFLNIFSITLATGKQNALVKLF